MTDYLNIQMTQQEIHAVSNLGLAHIGDCVYELLVRSFIVAHGGVTNQRMHRATVDLVCAAAQARAAETIAPLLTEEELAVFKRGDYRAATGLECLFGWLYLSARHERINELFAAILEKEACRLTP